MSATNLNTSEITDPGDAAAIPVTSVDILCGLDSSGGETRTLPDPKMVGQKAYFISAWTSGMGGTILMTADSDVDQTGNDKILFNSDGDFVALIGVKRLGSLRWQIIGSDGVALS